MFRRLRRHLARPRVRNLLWIALGTTALDQALRGLVDELYELRDLAERIQMVQVIDASRLQLVAEALDSELADELFPPHPEPSREETNP